MTLGVLETTQYLAENLEQLPEGAQSAWDSYQDRIDVAEAEGNVLLAEKLKAKRVYYFSSVLLPVTRASGDIIQEIKLLPAPRKVEASWGASEYRHGGLMTGIEHIMYRHSFDSGFSGVSRFSDGTSIRDVSYYVDSALRYGTVTDKGNGEFKIQYDFKYVIGYSKAGDPTSRIEMYVRDGIIQTAYPL